MTRDILIGQIGRVRQGDKVQDEPPIWKEGNLYHDLNLTIRCKYFSQSAINFPKTKMVLNSGGGGNSRRRFCGCGCWPWWQMTGDRWQMTGDRRRMTGDTYFCCCWSFWYWCYYPHTLRDSVVSWMWVCCSFYCHFRFIVFEAWSTIIIVEIVSDKGD